MRSTGMTAGETKLRMLARSHGLKTGLALIEVRAQLKKKLSREEFLELDRLLVKNNVDLLRSYEGSEASTLRQQVR